MRDLSRDEYSFKAERDHLADDTPCKCGSCARSWRYDQLAPIGDCSLTPGDPSPAGRCPDPGCDSLAYKVQEDEAPAGLMEAVRALDAACGEEGSEEEEAIADLPSTLNEALAEVIRYGSPHYTAPPRDLIAELRDLMAAGLTSGDARKVFAEGDQEGYSGYIAQARKDYATDELEIDDIPEVSDGEGGAWVAAWVWVRDDEVTLEEEEDEDDEGHGDIDTAVRRDRRENREADAAEGRAFETTVELMAHRVELRWWGIQGEVTDEALAEDGEERAREMIAQGYHSGELNHEGDETSARGWWSIAQ